MTDADGIALAATDLHTFYGKSHILHGVSLEVAAGRITTLLGRNGAGKTTTLRSLMGLTPARAGRVTIFGNDTTRWPSFRIAGLGVGYVPEGRRIFANLSVEENLKVPLERRGAWSIDRIYQVFPRLAERRASRGRQLSGGEQEMLAIARALLLNPKLLILDEPSQGLAPLVVRELFRIVAEMRKEGISVLLVEQNARMSLAIADNAFVLDNGRIVYSGPARELAADEARVQALAGASAEEWHQGGDGSNRREITPEQASRP
jgi:branched-chain amino acid transport system ATP-binding protein